jgi:hypothetical protein
MSGLNFNDTDNKAFTKSLIFSENNNDGAIVRNMTTTAYPNESIININPSNPSNNVTYNLPSPSSAVGFRYTFVISVNAGSGVAIRLGPTTDSLGGFSHTSDNGIKSYSSFSKLVFAAATAKLFDQVEFISDGSRWYFKSFHQGGAGDVSVEAAG